MPEVQEVFRMATQKVRPDPGFVERQHDHRRKQQRNRRIGAFAVVAAMGVVVAVVFASTRPGEEGRTPASPGPSVTGAGAPNADYVIDLNTGEVTPLPDQITRSQHTTGLDHSEGSGYAISPDGSQVAYVALGDRTTYQIFVADIDGTRVRQVTQEARRATSPAWSPDGASIAYVGLGIDRIPHLFVLDTASGDSTLLAGAGTVAPWAQPQFMPDGSSILYADGGGQHSVLRTIPVAGGKSTVMIGPEQGMGYAADGSLSPDGSLVTMWGNRVDSPGGHRFLANADGTGLRTIEGGDSTTSGTWSPDGSRIVSSDWNGHILVVNVATRQVSTVADGVGAIWLDDHTLLVAV
jgi:Tol biopolymer transport system component